MTDRTKEPLDENWETVVGAAVWLKQEIRAKLVSKMGWDRAGTEWSAARQRGMLKDIWTHVEAYRRGIDDWIRDELAHGRLPTHAGHGALMRSWLPDPVHYEQFKWTCISFVFDEERAAGAVLLPVGWIPEWTNEKSRRLRRPTEIYVPQEWLDRHPQQHQHQHLTTLD
jgi:hypothetical protein